MIDLNKTFILPTDCSFNCLVAMNYTPTRLKHSILSRPSSSLLYVMKGQYVYKWDDVELLVREGDLLYLPQGAAYTFEIISKKTYSLQIEFEIFAQHNDIVKSAALGNYPTIVLHNCGADIEIYFYDIINGFKSSSYVKKFNSNSAFMHLMSITFENIYNTPLLPDKISSKISPAIDYIEHNYNNKINIKNLSNMCGLSESHFRKLFVQIYGTSPLKYKNKLRMKQACLMLKSSNLNISEIAYALNFETVYLFSQTFKKEFGVSPKNYIKTLYH